MTPFEEILKFKIGIEMGLYDLTDLSSFLDEELLKDNDIPYIYIDVSSKIPHGVKPVLDCIFINFSDERYIEDDSVDCLIERYIIGDICKNFKAGHINLKQTCEFLHKLSLYFEPFSAMNAIVDYYDLAQNGVIYSPTQAKDMVEAILKRGL